jgi:hypothetical protein
MSDRRGKADLHATSRQSSLCSSDTAKEFSGCRCMVIVHGVCLLLRDGPGCSGSRIGRRPDDCFLSISSTPWLSREAGQSVLAGLSTIEHREDITAIVQETHRRISGQALEDALFRLAFNVDALEPAVIRRSVEKTLAEHPLQGIFDTTVLDSAGRTLAVVTTAKVTRLRSMGSAFPKAHRFLRGPSYSQLIQATQLSRASKRS